MPEASIGTAARPLQKPWRALANTSLLCFGIAMVIYALTDGSLWPNVLVSFAIGWSINLSFIFLGNFVRRWLSPYLASIPLVAVGLCTGLIISGLALFQNPWFYFVDSYVTLGLGVFFGIVGFTIFNTRGSLIAARAELTQASADRERQEKLLTQTELKLLQAQIEPHFLFNTLSNIAGLIHHEPDAAEKTLLNLTTLLRSSLQRTRQDATTLAEELAIAGAYLDIHAIRMHGRLRYTITSQRQFDSSPLPPLLVQPLVENAIKHGIDPCEDGGTIDIRVSATSAQLQIAVADTGIGLNPDQATAGTGTGLKNVRERLQALYDDQAKLTLTDNTPRGMIATLTLPL